MKKKTIIVVASSLILLYSCRKSFMEIDSVNQAHSLVLMMLDHTLKH